MRFSLDTIHRQDCIQALAALDEGSVDLAFADPPFNIGYDYDVYDDRKDAGSYLDWSREWICAVKRVLKPQGAFWLAIGDEYAAELKVLSQELGFHCRSWVIWYYTFGINCKKKFNRSHVHLFHFVVNRKEFTFNRQAIAVPSARQLVYADTRAHPDGRVPDDTWILRPQDCTDSFHPDEDTWYFPRVNGTFKERRGFHGCQMPEQLLGRIIRVCSSEGEVVLDPFSGSATTLAVARKLGRRFIGFDISEEYVARGLKRLEAISSGDPLEGAPEPLVSAPTTYSGALKPQTKKSPARRSPTTTPKERGLLDAFRKTHDGYSVDRVVADPDLNRVFLAECAEFGVDGSDVELNRTLFRLRKAGRLVQIPTLHRTTFAWEECDKYVDASEIALSQMIWAGCSTLDEVLTDPQKANEFDEIAEKFAPGFTPLQYRWAALKLRKVAKKVRVRSTSVGKVTLAKQVAIEDLARRPIDPGPGVYLVYSGQRRVLFAGDALDLSGRFDRAFKDRQLAEAWNEFGSQIRVKFATIDQQGDKENRKIHLLAQKTSLISSKNTKPLLNQLLHCGPE